VVPPRENITEEIATLLKNFVYTGGYLILYGNPSKTTLETKLSGDTWEWVAYGNGWTYDWSTFGTSSYISSPDLSMLSDLDTAFQEKI
jgi:hypothetical protein